MGLSDIDVVGLVKGILGISDDPFPNEKNFIPVGDAKKRVINQFKDQYCDPNKNINLAGNAYLKNINAGKSDQECLSKICKSVTADDKTVKACFPATTLGYKEIRNEEANIVRHNYSPAIFHPYMPARN